MSYARFTADKGQNLGIESSSSLHMSFLFFKSCLLTSYISGQRPDENFEPSWRSVACNLRELQPFCLDMLVFLPKKVKI